MEISLTSLGSSHTFRNPQSNTDAASRFCSLRDTILTARIRLPWRLLTTKFDTTDQDEYCVLFTDILIRLQPYQHPNDKLALVIDRHKTLFIQARPIAMQTVLLPISYIFSSRACTLVAMLCNKSCYFIKNLGDDVTTQTKMCWNGQRSGVSREMGSIHRTAIC